MSFTQLFKKLFGQPEYAPSMRDVKKTARPPKANPWHAVSIVPCAAGCRASQNALGVRHLSNATPPLPLPGCDAAHCQCRYRHHDDRRQSLRRTADIWNSNRLFKGPERRERRGRRADDGA